MAGCVWAYLIHVLVCSAMPSFCFRRKGSEADFGPAYSKKRFNRRFELVAERARSGQQFSSGMFVVRFIQASALGGDFFEKGVDV